MLPIKNGLSVIAAVFTLAAQAAAADPLPAEAGGKWGFADARGRFVIQPAFEAVRPFSGTLAAFRSGGKWGYLRRNGRAAIRNVFNEAGDFSEGLAAVRLNDRWGYIDASGQLVLAPEFLEAGPFAGGLAPVVLPAEPAPLRRWIDSSGAAVYNSVGPAGDGLEIILSSAGAYGFAAWPELKSPAVFENAAGCAGGLCLAGLGGRQHFVTGLGALVRPTEYEEAAALGCGLYRVGRGGKYGLISSTGAPVAQPRFDSIEGSGCGPGLAAVLGGAAGRLDAATGEFDEGADPAGPPPVRPGEKCLAVAGGLAAMDYRTIPQHCGAAELRAIVRRSSGCFNCLLAMARIYSSPGTDGRPADMEEALKALEEAVPLSSAPVAVHQWRADLLAASSAPADAARLAEEYHALIRLQPYRPELYRAVCRAYGRLAAPPADALRAALYCDLAVKLDSETAYNLLSRAEYKKLAGDSAGAMEDLKNLIELSSGSREARLARARISGALGQDYRAVFDCSRILETAGDDAEALEERALAYIRMGACEKARPDLQKARRLRPGPSNLHKQAVYRWLCDRDAPGTLAVIGELLAPSEQCGGSCWRPAEYEKYLGDLYGTSQYQGLLAGAAPEAGPSQDR